VTDFSDVGCTVYARELFDEGCRPDDALRIGGIGLDLVYQGDERGFQWALCGNPRCDHFGDECHNKSYLGVRANTATYAESHEHFYKKWGVVPVPLARVAKKIKKCGIVTVEGMEVAPVIVTPAMVKKRKALAEKGNRKKGPGGPPGITRRIEMAKQKAINDGEKTERMPFEDPEVDVVIPLSGTSFLPYLRNCLASLRNQTFPWGDMGVVISCVLHEDYNREALCCIAMKYEATVVFTKPRHETFSRGFALNVGARHGSRPLIAFLDSDVVLHKNTMRLAVAQCVAGAVMAVIPVVRTDCKPNHKIWTNGRLDNDAFWAEYTGKLPLAKGGYGNSVVNRAVFEKIRGHDERFYGWGGIDTDIYFRMIKSGRVVDMSEINALKALHQKHGEPLSKRDPKHTVRNRQLLDQSHSIVRNPKRWGRVRSR